MGGGVNLPNVSYCEKENEVHYNPLVIQPNNEIWYTTTDGEVVTPTVNSPCWNAAQKEIPIISNIYENGKGIIKFEKDCYQIREMAFKDCTSLASITIPNSIKEIPYGMLGGCTSLNNITIPESVTEILEYSFRKCTALTSITIPNKVRLIYDFAFAHCTSLTGITIPDSVTSIGKGVFLGWTGSTSADIIKFPNDELKIKYIEKAQGFQDWKSLTHFIIPYGTTKIGESTFSGCTSLTGITIPDSVTSIGHGAFAGWTGATSTDIIKFPNDELKIKYFEANPSFSGWTSLADVVIPEGVTVLSRAAFSRCSSLANITIPSTISEIVVGAFSNCDKLSSITILSETPPTLGSNAFYDIASNAVIYVPSGSVDAYKTATNWSTYASKIQAIPE